MTLRKITIDNSVSYVKKIEQKPAIIKNNSIPKKQSEQIKSISGGGNTRKKNSIPRKQDIKFSQNNKKMIKDNIEGSRFGILTN